MKKSITLSFICAALLTVVGCSTSISTNVDLTDDMLAQTLLAPAEVTNTATGVNGFDQARPALAEFDGRLDTELSGDYVSYVSRSWYDRPSNKTVLSNVLTTFTSSTDAKEFIDLQAEDDTVLRLTTSIGDHAVMYYIAASDDAAASVVYRFTLGHYAGKVQVSATTDDVTDDTQLQQALTPLATQLAEKQATKLQQALDQTLTFAPASAAVKHLPTTVSGTTRLGTTPVTDEEWLAIENDMTSDAIPGFVSAGLSRFAITARSEEVVEVTMFEFDTPNRATAFQEDFIAGADPDEIIDLPTSLGDQADALKLSSLVESQIAQDNYVIDVTIFSPFGDIDSKAAKTDLITMSAEVVNGFTAN